MDDCKEIIVKEYHNEKGLITRREIGEELVRCKDCKHHEELLNNNDGNVLCWVHGLDVIVDRNGYCSYGENAEAQEESEIINARRGEE